MTAFYGMYGYLGDYLHHSLGQPVIANGLVAMAYGIGFGAAALLGGVLDRIDARRLLLFSLLTVVGIYLALAIVGKSIGAVLAIRCEHADRTVNCN